jgi:hypothetical protein
LEYSLPFNILFGIALSSIFSTCPNHLILWLNKSYYIVTDLLKPCSMIDLEAHSGACNGVASMRYPAWCNAIQRTHRWRQAMVGDHTMASVDSPLPGVDVLCGTTIREESQAVFPVSQLGALVGYIRRPFNAELES